jgi:hypothetical protein
MMRKLRSTIAVIRLLSTPKYILSFLGVLCVLCGQSPAQDWKTVADGVEYAQVRREFSGKAVDINLLRLDLKKVRLDVHHAMDMAIGTEKTSSIATRHGAFAAINAGFFRLDKSEFAGDSAGILKINGKLLSESMNGRVAIGLHNGSRRTDVAFGHPQNSISVRDNDFTGIEVNGLNRERKANEVVVYTPAFGRKTPTNPEPNGVEYIVRKGRLVRISHSGGNEIPLDGFIISGTGDGKAGLMERWKVGSRLTLNTSIAVPMYDFQPDIDAEKKRAEREFTFSSEVYKTYFDLEDMTNGVPQLIKNSKIEITWEQEKASKSFVETRHPRTAVAKLKDGKFLMLTADGRTEQSAGLDLYDLAKYMLELGAIDAMNLDGGGSTTMFVRDKVVNRPSDKDGERKVSDAILVTLRSAKRPR